VASALPTLPADETYQLWANIGGQPVSLGLLGDRVEPGAAFSLRSERGRAVEVLVTVEPAGGVVVPDRAPIASGRVVV
jgi:anti-sigma-K factor RskA